MNIDFEKIPASLCVSCKGTRLLCGKSSCPILAKYYSSSNLKLDLNEVEGSSPPSIFVGAFGYPRVRIGPALPPVTGDTEIYERPDKWIGMRIEKIAEMRLSLYRGYKTVPVLEAVSPGSYLSDVHDIILSSRPVEVELVYSRAEKRIDLSPESQPFGPGGYLKKFEHGGSSSSSIQERYYYDTDIPASEAVMAMYNEVSLYSIEKMLSAGMLGKQKNRKIVPTRWSITAVDKIISDSLISEIKHFPIIDRIEYFNFSNIGNEYYICILPGPYSFEMVEDWNNGSIWTGTRGSIVEGDYEDLKHREPNPSIGGSFFAAKLPILDYMKGLELQGRIIVARFIGGDYTMPLGVWQVRENVRQALTQPSVLENIEEFFSLIDIRRKINLRQFSKTYQMIKNQRRLTDYGGVSGT